MNIKKSISRDYNIEDYFKFSFIGFILITLFSSVLYDADFGVVEADSKIIYYILLSFISLIALIVYIDAKHKLYYRVVSKKERQGDEEKTTYIVLKIYSTKPVNEIVKKQINSWEKDKVFNSQKKALEYFKSKTFKKVIEYKDLSEMNYI